ncbi:MAG: glycogen debranching protein GlgX [Bacteroidota bacterium]
MLKKEYPGSPFPLGATWDGQGVNFALYSENATAVYLCLFNSPGDEKEFARYELKERTNHIWHIYLPNLKTGQLYAYRVNGPFDPKNGHRFNINKLLADPYAKAIAGNVIENPAIYAYIPGHADEDLSFSETDSSAYVPKCVVTHPYFDWEGDRQLCIPYDKLIIYELHIKGFSKLNTKLPEEIRGTYEGLAHPFSIKYLKEMGITAVELMPVHHFVDDGDLTGKGLRNYWGYNTLGFLAPDSRYASRGVLGEQVQEFKNMVKELHKAGIEVILDVVYNHTGEGNHMGPTLSFRGIDNASYYRLTDDKRYYMDFTGVGNTPNTRLPDVLRLIMDSLRYWVTEMHVDGFRFDLASTLARELSDVNRLSSFFEILHQDPVLSQVKLIAEPWDIGEDGYLVGKFPPGWCEWNGQYRDSLRNYWRGQGGMLGEFAQRFTGSADLYKDEFRNPSAGINYITSHDGFNLNDLVSYNDKHNEANKNNNNDGPKENLSNNYGAEGETDNADIIALRRRQKRNMLATLFLSQGVPMLLAGDEMGHTQKGNNNTYCQDNELTWLNFENADNELCEFTRSLISLRKLHPAFCRRRWFLGENSKGRGPSDIAWFLPDGREMEDENWEKDFARSMAVYLNGSGLNYRDERGDPIEDDSFYLIFNAYELGIDFTLPPKEYGEKWILEFDTKDIKTEPGKEFNPGQALHAEGRSVVLLRRINTTNE